MFPADQPSEGPCDPRELARRLQGLNLYLVGMMGAGKSAVGRPLADALGYTFIDADDTLVRASGRSIPQVFAEDGEDGFRRLETQVLNQIACIQRLVVATGGGVVTRPENWGHLRQEDLLLERLRNDPTPRPLLNDPDPSARLGELLGQRRPLYAQADLTIRQEEASPQDVAARILVSLPSILREPSVPPNAPAALVDGEGRITPSLN
jgi:shikimate kinase